jgi:hypothetical protein
MPRPPIGKKAMTPAERQRKRRKRLKKERSAEWHHRERQRKRRAAAETHAPMPPGIYYWRAVRVRAEDGEVVEIRQPHAAPLAAVRDDLTDDEVLALLDELHGIAQRRGLDLSRVPPYPQEVRPPDPREGCTVSALPRASAAR